MTDQRIVTKAALLAAIETAWEALNAAIDRLTPDQLTGARDAQGWSVTDHLSHLMAWERSVAFLLTGRPRHEGLAVDAALYAGNDYDAINAAVQQRHADRAPEEVVAQLRATHAALLEALHSLSDAELHRPNRQYRSASPDSDDGPPVIDVIFSNTAHHFAEHQAWIEALAV